MLGDLFAELRAQARERIKSPLLGPFMIGWIVSNWKMVSILLVSNQSIEQRILHIDENYLNVSQLIVAPLIFALLFALGLPWINFGIQNIQERANLLRRKHKLIIDTEYLTASVDRAEAQATLNLILAKDQITERQNEEIESLKEQLTEQHESAQFRIEATKAELEERQKEYEARTQEDQVMAVREREEIEKLHAKLEKDRENALVERENALKELKRKQKELQSRLEGHEKHQLTSTSVDFEDFLVSGKFRLYHNPSVGPQRSKTVVFKSGGKISEGGNDNENSWRIVKGKLELVQADGRLHSRFFFLPESKIFVHTGDTETISARGQYIVPEIKGLV